MLSITINGISLPFVKEVRNLGVVMMSNLSWRSNVASLSLGKFIYRYRLKFHRGALSVRLRTMLISCLIVPLLDYCCLVYSDLTAEQDVKLQSYQLHNKIHFYYVYWCCGPDSFLNWDVHGENCCSTCDHFRLVT